MVQDSEEAAEFVVTVRNEHVKMKEWYTNSQSAATSVLKEKYGPYPSMWKEVLNWPGWKEARKEYLKEEQQKSSQSANHEEASHNRKRKSRWGTAANDDDMASKRIVPPPPSLQPPPFLQQPPQQQQPQAPPLVVLPSVTSVNPNLTPQQQQELKNLQSKLRLVNERLDKLEEEAARVDALPRGHPERSPSPPMIYGADGKRKNTRAVRWRERYTAERQDLLESIMRLSSKGSGGPSLGGLPAGASSLLVRRRVKKIRIPIEEHPNYNFIGLIIGPRGKTQKELESKTGCKIAIRGRGSVKEGARGRRDGKVMEGDNEPLHVVISGDDQRAVDAAADMIEQMLVVIDDEKNVHKQQQLRELALLNGTLKEEEVFCQICAEKGHRSFECPKRFAVKGGAVGVTVKCAICGDTSHPTRDCTRKTVAPAVAAPNGDMKQEQIDSEYLSFMAELDGKKEEVNMPVPHPVKSEPASNLPPPPLLNVSLPLPPQPTGLPLPPPIPQPPAIAPPPSNFNQQQQQQQQSRPPPQSYGQYGNGVMGHPPHQQQSGYGGNNYNQQYAQGGYGGQQQQYPNYGQQQQQQYHQQGQPQQQQQAPVKPGEETAGWDPSSYYSSYDGNGAGGFNWWEQ